MAASKQKEDERFSISGSLPTLESFFNFFTLYSFLSLHCALCLFWICSYSFPSLDVNSESEAKLSSFSRECLALGLEEELWRLYAWVPHQMHLYLQSLREKRFLSLQRCWLLLVMVGLNRHLQWSESTVCMDRNRCYSGGHQCLAVGCDGKYDMSIMFRITGFFLAIIRYSRN
jgi:hypothetical protein